MFFAVSASRLAGERPSGGGTTGIRPAFFLFQSIAIALISELIDHEQLRLRVEEQAIGELAAALGFRKRGQ